MIHTYFIYTTVSPHITFEATPLRVINGMTHTLTCTVVAVPEAFFAEISLITSNGERLPVAHRITMAGVKQFSMTHQFTANFTADDGVVYQCLAENINGRASVNVTIIVQGKLKVT